MHTSAWQTVDTTHAIAEIQVPSLPSLDRDKPFSEPPRNVSGIGAEAFAWSAVELRIEQRRRPVNRPDLEPIDRRAADFEVRGSALVEAPQVPAAVGVDRAETPCEASTFSLLSVFDGETFQQTEFLPVLARLTIWSPLPATNHECLLRSVGRRIAAEAPVDVPVVHQFEPMEPETGWSVERDEVPEPIGAGMPDRAPVRNVATRSYVQRKEPEVRILGNVIRYEFPTLN